MSEIINLNKTRKAKALVEREKKASHNRVKFGRTKQEKNAEKLKTDKLKKFLKDHELDKKDD